MHRAESKLLVSWIDLQTEQRGSDPAYGHLAFLCSVATAHALNPGPTSCNTCGTLLWTPWG